MEFFVELAAYAARLDSRLDRMAQEASADLPADSVALQEDCRTLRADAVEMAVTRTVVPDVPPCGPQE